MANSDSQAIQERLNVIEESIQRTLQNLREDSHNFLFWGWLIVATCILHFSILNLFPTPYHWLPWPITMSLGGIYSWIYNIRHAKEKKVMTHIDRFMAWLWATSGIIFFTIAFMCMKFEIIPIPFLLLTAALATAVSGGILKFRPLILGGVFFFLMAITTVFAPIYFPCTQ
jgi:hypothetical protein